jgi:hypothetical protein
VPTELELQARLDSIDAAIASGSLRVSYEGKGSVEYRSLADLFKVRDDLRAQLGAPRSLVRRTAAAFSGGF